MSNQPEGEVHFSLVTQKEFDPLPTQFESWRVVVSALGCDDLFDELETEIQRRAQSVGVTREDFFFDNLETVEVADEDRPIKLSAGPTRTTDRTRLLYKLDLVTGPLTIRFYGTQGARTMAGYSIIKSWGEENERVVGNKTKAAREAFPDDPKVDKIDPKLESKTVLGLDGNMTWFLLMGHNQDVGAQLNIAKIERVVKDVNIDSTIVILREPVGISYGSTESYHVVALELRQALLKEREHGSEPSVYNHGEVLLWSLDAN